MGMPLYQALLILATIVSGGLFYDEFGRWAVEVGGQPGVVAGFVGGVATLILGIVLVAQKPDAGQEPDGASKGRSGTSATSIHSTQSGEYVAMV